MNEFARSGLAVNQLPSVSAADNDKILAVKDGVWAVAENSGGGTGGGGLLVNVTEQGDASVCDKTAGEIMTVVEAGGSVVFKTYEAEDELYTYAIVSTAQTTPDNYYFTAAGVQYSADSAEDYPATSGK